MARAEQRSARSKATPLPYVALLRAINVGGHSGIRMAALRELFEACGLTDVSTYIQSGNVLFTTMEADRDPLVQLLETRIEAAFPRGGSLEALVQLYAMLG